ncbi:hypothetical protein GT037_010362 [Alternaria burnsii]|uniref:RBR-type E3 ubiquitin transferase n=1 Tax=Alternaria burnsii TaxID=1187904 RepID=A0A8H7ED50_9PLEO|nr:uncharacterized protein GT037_010362 [Alternaria burnsii]KAF7671550.1 hypothetical protein GT037_010362 [Alternaria burnsii]
MQTKPSKNGLLSGGHDRSAQPGTLSATCCSCLDMHAARNMLQLPCRDDGDVEAHAYCRECLTRLFECSITDTSHFPPRCCSKIIPIFNCIPFLPSAVFSRFVAKREELEMADRTYCSNRTCSNWIRPASIVADIATCAECAQKTCVTCKNERHDGLCSEDKDVKKLMRIAKAKRWKTCPKCKEMVELERGCFHIKCRCQYEFCYTCLAKWRTCKCPLWDERRIVDRHIPANNAPQNVVNLANAVPPIPVARPNPLPAQPTVRAAQPQPQVPAQPAVHVHKFERYYLSEGHDTICDRCGFMDKWADSCQGCDLTICRLCTKHRLGRGTES